MTDSSLIRKGDNATCLSRVAYGHAGLLFYRRCGVARGRKPHCRTRADEVRTDGGMTGDCECVYGGMTIGWDLIFNVLLNELNLCDSALPL